MERTNSKSKDFDLPIETVNSLAELHREFLPVTPEGATLLELAAREYQRGNYKGFEQIAIMLDTSDLEQRCFTFLVP